MRLKTTLSLLVLLIALGMGIPAEAARPVHWFDCSTCHNPGVSTTSLGGNNVCFQCHKDSPAPTTFVDGGSYKPHGVFSTMDASNAMGAATAAGVTPTQQTSHYWASTKDVVAAAGALAPSAALYRSRYGISNGKVTCTRCHDPHLAKNEAVPSAPANRLLRLGSADAMCLDCHRLWNVGATDHGLNSHPLVADYPTFAGNNPLKYKPAVYNATTLVLNANTAKGGVRLVASAGTNNISCSSCHGVHFADSNSSTSDGVAQSQPTNAGYDGGLTTGDGKLLLSDGRGVYNTTTMGYEGTNASILCQTCHTYKAHGSAGETVGCLICHSGHSYATSQPNYYVLRKATSTATYNAATLLDYSVLTTTGGGARTISQAWAGTAGAGVANGYCERCHGEVSTMVGSLRVHPDTGEDCVSCHKHHDPSATYSFEANCTGCHGFPPKANVAGGPDGYAVSGAANYSTVSGGAIFKNELNTPHNTHAGEYAFSCDDCHKGHDHDSGASSFQDVFLSPAGTLAGASASYATAGSGTCTTVYCHSNGRSGADARTASVSWAGGNGTITVCDACHGNDAIDMASKNDTAAHIKHLSKGYACNVCHQTTATSASALNLVEGKPPISHVDGDADVAFDTSYLLSAGNPLTVGATPWSGTGCDTVYCHSNGQDIPSYTSIAWTASTTGDCGKCHAAGTAMATGSHAAHVNGASGDLGRAITCGACHADTASNNTTLTGGVSTATHVNGARDVRMNIFSDTGSCSSIYCHSNGNAGNLVYASLTWGSPLSGCDDCHGDGAGKAYPSYANGGAAHTNANSHAAHVLNRGYACGECHKETSADGTAINGTIKTTHVNQTVNVLGDKINGGAAGWNNTTKTCSTVSCHGGNNVVWGATLTCGDCHSSASDVDNFANDGTTATIKTSEWTSVGHGQAAVGLVAKANGGDACLWCHDTTAPHDITSATNPFRLKGKDALGNGWNDVCLVCHDTDATTNYTAGEAGFTNLLRSGVTKVDKWHQMGAHAQAADDRGLFCWDCHDPHGDGSNIKMIQSNPPTNTTNANGVPTGVVATAVVFTNNALATGAGGFAMTGAPYAQGVCNACHISSASNPKMLHYTTTASDSHNSGTVCTSCHDHGTGTNGGDAFKATCYGCHGGDSTGSTSGMKSFWPDTGTGADTGTPDDAGRHQLHIIELAKKVNAGYNTVDKLLNGLSELQQKQLCEYCHAAVTNDADHTSGDNADVFDTSLGKRAKAIWDGSADANATYVADGCNNVNCHNNKATGTTTYGWYDAGTTACIMCHNNVTAGTTDGTTSRSHVMHSGTSYLYTFNCQKCHPSGTAWGTPGTKPSSGHLNGQLNISGTVTLNYNTATSYNGNQMLGTIPGNCSANDCHNNGRDGNPVNMTYRWGDNIGGCATCHAHNNATHNAHMGAAGTFISGGYWCDDCHTHDGIVSGSGHIDRDIDLLAGMNYNSAVPNLAVNAAADYGTCSTTTCHNDGKGVAVKTPFWNRTASSADNCSVCHAGVPNTASHSKHVKLAQTPTAYNGAGLGATTQTDYSFRCDSCHTSSLSNHLNNQVNVAAAVTYNSATYSQAQLQAIGGADEFGKCSTSTCHSNGAATPVYSASPVWGASFAGDTCAGCHGNSPDTNAHAAHVVAIHWDSVNAQSSNYSGTTGLQGAANDGASGHGKLTTSSVINCNICHNATVTNWQNDNNTTCATGACHDGGYANGNANGVAVIADKRNHVNGVADVAMLGTLQFKTRAQLRNNVASVPEINNTWDRLDAPGGILGLFYKGLDNHDRAKTTFNTATMYNSSNVTCSNIACHNGYDIQWTKAPASYSCDACHTQLP